jgi:hypothetical protein
MYHEDMHQQMQTCRRLFGSTGHFCSSTQFCKRDYCTLARVYNVIGLHGSWLGQLP